MLKFDLGNWIRSHVYPNQESRMLLCENESALLRIHLVTAATAVVVAVAVPVPSDRCETTEKRATDRLTDRHRISSIIARLLKLNSIEAIASPTPQKIRAVPSESTKDGQKVGDD
jgi:hypothetical protein